MAPGVKHQPKSPKYRSCDGYELAMKTTAGDCKITIPLQAEWNQFTVAASTAPSGGVKRHLHENISFPDSSSEVLFCGQKNQGDETPWLVFGAFSPGCVDQGLRVQRLFILVRCGKSSGTAAQLRGWRRISQPMATTPSLQATELSNNPKRHCSLLGHLPLHHP